MKKPRNSYISNSKHIFYIIVFLLGFIIIAKFLSAELIFANEQQTFFISEKWADFYSKDKDSIEVLVLGPSTAMQGVNPNLFKDLSGLETYNMATPLQKPKESYFILKECLNTQNPKYLLMDNYWGVIADDDYIDTKIVNYSEMKYSKEKIEYFFNVFKPDQYFYGAFPLMNYHKETFKLIDYRRGVLEHFPTKEEVKDIYLGNGFDKRTLIWNGNDGVQKLSEKGTENKFIFSKEEVKYLKKIYELCEEKNIKVIAFTSALAPEYIKYYDNSVCNYAEINRFVTDFNKEKEIPYKDLNLADIDLKSTDFADTHHLNYDGATKFTNALYEFFKENL